MGRSPCLCASLPKCTKRVDHSTQIAVVLVPVAAPPAGKADCCLQALLADSPIAPPAQSRRSRRRRSAWCPDPLQAGPAQTSSPRADRPRLPRRFAQSFRAWAAAAIDRILLPSRTSISSAHHDDGYISTAREPQCLSNLRPWSHVRAIFWFVRCAMRQHHKRMPSRQVRIHFQRIQAVGEGLRHMHPHLSLHQINRDSRRCLCGCGQAGFLRHRAHDETATRTTEAAVVMFACATVQPMIDSMSRQAIGEWDAGRALRFLLVNGQGAGCVLSNRAQIHPQQLCRVKIGTLPAHSPVQMRAGYPPRCSAQPEERTSGYLLALMHIDPAQVH